MKRQSISAAMAGVFVLSVSARVQGESPVKTFQAEARAYYQQAKASAAPKAARLKELRGQVPPLQAQLKNAKDTTTLRQITSQLDSLRAEINALAEDLALHDIDMIQHSLTFDRRRLDFAQQRLANIRASKPKKQ